MIPRLQSYLSGRDYPPTGHLCSALRRTLLISGAILAFNAAPALACPTDNGPAPANIKNDFCGAWNAAGDANLGSPLNDAHRWANGWIRDFDGGAWSRGGIMEGDGEGWAFIVAEPWWDTFVGSGGAPGPLGYPTGEHVFGGHLHQGPNANTYMTFQGGVINHWAGGTFETHGAILTKWNSVGNVSGALGRPLSNEANTLPTPDGVVGRYSRFEGGVIDYNPRINGAFLVYGGILNKYASLGYSASPLGLPTSDRQTNPGRGNEYQVFDGGVINQYGGNAYETHGAILAKWNALGGANGPVGLPTSDEGQTARVNGRYSKFEGGVIDYNPRVNGAFLVYGGILNKYAQLGYSNHPLGLPVSDRKPGSVSGDDYQVFDGGVINQYGGNAYETHGAILDRWNHAGGPTGSLGLPTSDEQYTSRSPQGTLGRYSRFQHGVINYNPKINRAIVLFGAIGAKYAQMGYAASYLGLPTSEEQDLAGGGKRQNFEGGYIVYQPGVGARTDRELGGGGRNAYVIRSLGDSFTAGFGLSLSLSKGIDCARHLIGHMPTTACDNPYDSWAGKTVGLLHRGLLRGRAVDYAPLAVSGSTPSDWLGNSDRGDVRDFPSRLRAVIQSHPDLILLSLGGVNVLGADASCTTDASCIAYTLAITRAQMTTLLRRLMTQTRARIYVLLYPSIHGDNVGLVSRLDTALKAAIQATGSRVKYIQPPPFAGHDCGDSGKGSWRLGWDQVITIPNFFAPLCIHPNEAGSQALANSANATINSFGL